MGSKVKKNIKNPSSSTASSSSSAGPGLGSVRVGSAGYKAGNFSYFIAGEGAKASALLPASTKRWKRGWNIVYKFGQQLSCANFDPYDTNKNDATSLVEFMKTKLKGASLVLVSVRDEGGRQMESMAQAGLAEALIGLGLKANKVASFMGNFGKRQSVSIIAGSKIKKADSQIVFTSKGDLEKPVSISHGPKPRAAPKPSDLKKLKTTLVPVQKFEIVKDEKMESEEEEGMETEEEEEEVDLELDEQEEGSDSDGDDVEDEVGGPEPEEEMPAEQIGALVPYEERGIMFDKAGAWLQHLVRFGYVIIQDFLTDEQLELEQKNFWSMIREVEDKIDFILFRSRLI